MLIAFVKLHSISIIPATDTLEKTSMATFLKTVSLLIDFHRCKCNFWFFEVLLKILVILKSYIWGKNSWRRRTQVLLWCKNREIKQQRWWRLLLHTKMSLKRYSCAASNFIALISSCLNFCESKILLSSSSNVDNFFWNLILKDVALCSCPCSCRSRALTVKRCSRKT